MHIRQSFPYEFLNFMICHFGLVWNIKLKSVCLHAMLLLILVFITPLAISQVDIPSNIQYAELEHGVKRWSWVRAEDEKPWFFKQVENIFRVALPSKDELPFGRSVAFLVGVSEYKHLKTLPFVENDLRDFREFLLTKGGFDTVYVADNGAVTPELVEDYMMNRFRKLLGERDRLLFYYAGHGADSVGKTGYMQFSQARPDDFARHVLEIRRWMEWSRVIQASHILFIYDCCASGLALTDRSETTPTEDYKKILHAFSREGSRTVITAGTANEKTYEIPNQKGGGNGVFTRALLNAVESGKADERRNKDGFMTIDEIFTETKNGLTYFAKDYGERLTPRIRSFDYDDEKYKGTFIFVNSEAKTIELPDRYSQALNAQPRHDNSAVQENGLPSGTLLNLAKAAQKMGEYSDAEAAYKAALGRAKKEGDKIAEARAQMGLGETYQEMRQYQKAVEAYNAAQTISKAIPDKLMQARASYRMGILYESTGKFADALTAFQSSFEIGAPSGPAPLSVSPAHLMRELASTGIIMPTPSVSLAMGELNAIAKRNERRPIPLSPALTAVRSVQPTLRWEAVPESEAYQVVVTDLHNNRIWTGDAGARTQIELPADKLQPGQIYLWRVETVVAGQPRHSPIIGFWVIDLKTLREVEVADQSYRDSALVCAIIYQAYGLYEEALTQIERLTAMDTTDLVVQKMRRNLRRQLGKE